MAEQNRLGLEKRAYGGSPSTLCTGCGHDLISNHVISACYNADIPPHRVAKMSGIGCSSKIPAYFMSGSFAFNSMHGRMAPIATGAGVVQPSLRYLGVSGDGDTASIGLGGFIHLLRRNLPICYIIADNGVYGLTKGQFSATAEASSVLRTGEHNLFESLDICALSVEAGASFVARAFAGDAKQMVPMIQAGLFHQGTAVIDVISPCITFNNHDGSTKSYSYVKEHDVVLQELGLILEGTTHHIDYPEGSTERVDLLDGRTLTLRKLDSRAHNVRDREAALRLLHESQEAGELLTGLIYVNEKKPTLQQKLALSDRPLANLTEVELRPPREQMKKLLAQFR
ncbi:MAG: 2-oxoglutarate ferredoxin oxidoreductase subunit beta [Bdellovibrio sp.]|nr:MAG: 2-oxoglutarate ferredoxin oxidoreductase subunit beta [Bdellovibrio sp.]